ncbi:hypothetical protein [Desulfosporosinus fructosivorans]|nr:hypothetical protein [Desulfosporosinus fructosivorans]
MIDWNLAIKIFVSGVSIVMLVMFILQITVQISSIVVRLIEKKAAKVEN